MRPSDVRRLRRLRSRAAILAANGGKDRDSIGAREARVRSIDGPDLADLIEDRSGILADLVAGWKADDERILADLARSFGMTDKAKD